jgi:colanic acid biosynthesis protein WcaH
LEDRTLSGSQNHLKTMADFIPAKLYYQILERMPIACVDVAIVAAGSVLLVKRCDAPARDSWWVPGGRVLKGEKMRETAARKALEEVGMVCHVGPIIHTAETIFPDGPGGVPIHSINSCFFLYPADADIALSLDDHHEDVKWVRSIPEGLHPYVTACLRGAGLEHET